MKKQRWRKTKIKICHDCGKVVDTSLVHGRDDWSHKNKILYSCHDCMFMFSSEW